MCCLYLRVGGIWLGVGNYKVFLMGLLIGGLDENILVLWEEYVWNCIIDCIIIVIIIFVVFLGIYFILWLFCS